MPQLFGGARSLAGQRALDPVSHVVYVPMAETCTNYTWTARQAPDEQVAKGRSST